MSPNPEQREYAAVLLSRAQSDARACRTLLADSEMTDDVIGFHAQQAVEKALKVALVLRGAAFPRTHDLGFLVARARESGLQLPEAVGTAEWLSPWAAQLRHDEPPAPLDRAAAMAAADVGVRFAAELSAAAGAGPAG